MHHILSVAVTKIQLSLCLGWWYENFEQDHDILFCWLENCTNAIYVIYLISIQSNFSNTYAQKRNWEGNYKIDNAVM